MFHVKQPVHFDLWYDGAWHEQADAVYDRDPVTITRGRTAPGEDAAPASAVATFGNLSGDYNPRNIAGALFGKIGRNTPFRIRCDVDPLGVDTFDRTVVGGWGSDADLGSYWHVWTAGSLANFDVGGGVGTMYVPSAGNYSQTYLQDLFIDDPDVTVVSAPPMPTGAVLETGPILMVQASTTYYMVRAEITTAGVLTLALYRREGSVQTTLATAVAPFTFDGTPLRIRARYSGGLLEARVWEVDQSQPSTWLVSAYDDVLITPGGVGLRSGRAVGNTNTADPQFYYGDFSVTGGGTRFVGEIFQWRPGRAKRGDAWASIQAASVLRRLGRGTDPIRSVAYQALVQDDEYAPYRVAVWPLEEEADATVLSSPTGAPPLAYGGDITPGAFTRHPAAERLLTFGAGGLLHATVPAYASSDAEILTLWDIAADADMTDQVVMMRAYCAGGNVDWIDLQYRAGGGLSLHAWRAGSQIDTTGAVSFDVDGLTCAIDLSFRQNGANLDVEIDVYRTNDVINGFSDVFNSITLGRVTYVSVGAVVGGTDIDGCSVGFLAIGTDPDAAFLNFLAPIDSSGTRGTSGYLGERAGQRLQRLLRQAGVPSGVLGGAASRTMGPQRAEPLHVQLEEIELTDDAHLFEPRASRGVVLLTGAGKLNRGVAATIDRTASGVSDLAPVDGDQYLRNDVTVRNVWSGAEGRAVQETGPNNVGDPIADPAAVGRFVTRIDVNLESDDGVQIEAGWRLSLGTWDLTWYRLVTIDLDAAPQLAPLVGVLDIGSHVLLTGLPADETAADVPHLVIGVQEEFRNFRRKVTLYLEPAGPYLVGELDDLGYLDCGASTLASGVDDNDTALMVAVGDTCLWPVGAGLSVPLLLGSEPVTLTAVTGATSPQTLTVTRGTGGVAAAWPAGTEVHVAQPIIPSPV